jgi:hypothetical protein
VKRRTARILALRDGDELLDVPDFLRLNRQTSSKNGVQGKKLASLDSTAVHTCHGEKLAASASAGGGRSLAIGV